MLGFAENLDQLAELKQNGFSFSLYMTDSAEALLDKDRIVKTLEPDEIIEGRGTEPPETVAAGFENVIVPAMTVNTASKIASCMHALQPLHGSMPEKPAGSPYRT